MQRTLGFTRFEFAISIAIVGVLIAIALPRMDAARVAARQVRLKSLLATAQSSAMLFNLRCQGQPACDTLAIEGRKVAGVHAWPAASEAGIVTALKPWGPAADIDWRPERVNGVPALRARLTPTTVAGACEFIYVQASAPGEAPRIELIDASCP